MSLPLLSFSSPLFEAPAGEQGGGGGSAAKAQPRSGLSLPPIEDIAREVVPPQPEEAPEDPQLAATADAGPGQEVGVLGLVLSLLSRLTRGLLRGFGLLRHRGGARRRRSDEVEQIVALRRLKCVSSRERNG